MVKKKRYRFRRSLILPLIYIFLTALSFSTLNTNKTNSKFFDSKNKELDSPSIKSLYDNSTNTVSIVRGNNTSVTLTFGYAFHRSLATDISDTNPVNYNLYFNDNCSVIEIDGETVDNVRTKTFTLVPNINFVSVSVSCNLEDIKVDDSLVLDISLKEQYGTEMEFDYKDYHFEMLFEDYKKDYFPPTPDDNKTPEERFYEELIYAVNNYADNLSTSGLITGVDSIEYSGITNNIKSYVLNYYSDVASVTHDNAKFDGLPGLNLNYNETTEEYSFEIDDNIISYAYTKARPGKLYYFVLNESSDEEKINKAKDALDVFIHEYYSADEDLLKEYFSLVSTNGIGEMVVLGNGIPGVKYIDNRKIEIDVEKIRGFMTLNNQVPIIKSTSSAQDSIDYFKSLFFVATRDLNIDTTIDYIYSKVADSVMKSWQFFLFPWPVIRDFYAIGTGDNSNDFILFKFYNGSSTDEYNYVDIERIDTEDDLDIVSINGNVQFDQTETSVVQITISYMNYEHAKSAISQMNSFFGIDDSAHPLPDVEPSIGFGTYSNGSYSFDFGTRKNIYYSFYKYDDASTAGVNEEMTIVYDAASDQSIASFSMNSNSAPQTQSIVEEEDKEEEQGLGDKIIDTVESLMFLPRFLKSLF